MKSKTLVKICGITNLADAQTALDAGADWIGLNLVAGPRKLTLDRATDIASQLPDASRIVALVPVTDTIVEALTLQRLTAAAINKLQLYGDTTPTTFADLRAAGFETFAVLRAKGHRSLVEFAAVMRDCGNRMPDYVVLDAYVARSLGGTGQRADWETILAARGEGILADWPPLILAGGLTPENVARAIAKVTPFGVDVSSGVESSTGKKDRVKIEAFLAAVKA